MVDLPEALVGKLTHRLAEIRDRALQSIADKLEKGPSCSLARTRQLLFNLFQWFLLEPCSQEAQVLNLIGLVLQSDTGRTLTQHLGRSAIEQELRTIRSCIPAEFHGKIDAIEAGLGPVEVPPLCAEVPLSFRSIEGLVQKSASVPLEDGCSVQEPPQTFRWQPLIDTDQSVLSSIEGALRGPESASQLFHSCQFFSEVLLRDFPAEVFLQRPGIVHVLLDLLANCSSRRLCSVLLRCLSDLTRALQIRLNHRSDYCLRTEKVPEGIGDVEPDTGGQLSIEAYCSKGARTALTCLKQGPRLNQAGLTGCLGLLNQLLGIAQSGDCMALLGDTLEHFRLECSSLEGDLQCRAIYLHLLCLTAKWLVPPSGGSLLPRSLRLAISHSLLDVGLSRLFPAAHRRLLSCTAPEDLKRFETVQQLRAALSAALQLRQAPHLSAQQKILLIRRALPSVELQSCAQFLRDVVDVCGADTVDAQDVVLQLLAHPVEEVRAQMYELCHEKVAESVGAQSRANPARIAFLLEGGILREIAQFGLACPLVARPAEDMLLYLLKRRVLAEPKSARALICALPILLCHGHNGSSLGRTVLDLVDPDTAQLLGLPQEVMLKGNIQLLFAKDSALRDEAVSRLCWLMARQEEARHLLPKISSTRDRVLSGACVLKPLVDVNKMRHSQHFYQPSSLEQVVELLRDDNVEPVIRRSALNQVSVMLEDQFLHATFLDKGGLELLMGLMGRALTETDFRDYPDSVVAIVAAFRTLALYNCSVRVTLSTDPAMLFWLLRGLFLFVTDDRMRQDAAILLFLLVFNDFLTGSPSRGDLAIPSLVGDRLLVPFQAAIGCSRPSSSLAHILQDRWSLSALQVHWNWELHGGLQGLLALQAPGSSDRLALSAPDLAQLKMSSAQLQVRLNLQQLQTAATHPEVQASLEQLIVYLHLHSVASQLGQAEERVLDAPWKEALWRFLEAPPSSDEDLQLLDTVIQLLILLVPLYKEEERCWVGDLLLEPGQPLLDLLEGENGAVGRGLLQLITVCVVRDHHYLEGLPGGPAAQPQWGHLVRHIGDQLRLNSAQHFYNLAYLDALLSCLVHLTARLGWSAPHWPLDGLVASLCELLRAFHYGKGPSAAVSMMGLSISRHALFILNHLAAEMQRAGNKAWERCFLQQDCTGNIVAMWASRDVLLRAAALQLTACLAQTAQMEELWEGAMEVVGDHAEAGIVRENAALLLANLAGHQPPKTRAILGQVEAVFEGDVATPGLVRALCLLLDNVADAPTSAQLQEMGLVKLIFRTLRLPALATDTKRQLALYCNILEMNASVCSLLRKLCAQSCACRGTVLHTRDCLSVLLGLLNAQNYSQTQLAQLTYLKNCLWTQVLHLVAALATGEGKGASILVQTVQDTGLEPFFRTLCQALRSTGADELQNAALAALAGVGSPLAALLDCDSAAMGAELCKVLLLLHEMARIQKQPRTDMVLAALTVLLSGSEEAKTCALSQGLMQTVVQELRELHMQLSLQAKKGIPGLLRSVADRLRLMTNFLLGSREAKILASRLCLADAAHKLWMWCVSQRFHAEDMLRMLAVFTQQCPEACRSLPMTSPVAGAGPRKTPSNVSLLHCLTALISKEMELVTRSHNLATLELALDILRHCCAVLECRLVLSKANLFQAAARLQPGISRKQAPWERVELLWMDFLDAFTRFPEGQAAVGRAPDLVGLLVALAGGGATSFAALSVLRNVAFYQPNRARLLASADFLRLLQLKLGAGSKEGEQQLAVAVMWALAANNQRAKIAFKAANLDTRLAEAARSAQLLNGPAQELEMMDGVLDVLKGA